MEFSLILMNLMRTLPFLMSFAIKFEFSSEKALNKLSTKGKKKPAT